MEDSENEGKEEPKKNRTTANAKSGPSTKAGSSKGPLKVDESDNPDNDDEKLENLDEPGKKKNKKCEDKDNTTKYDKNAGGTAKTGTKTGDKSKKAVQPFIHDVKH